MDLAAFTAEYGTLQGLEKMSQLIGKRSIDLGGFRYLLEFLLLFGDHKAVRANANFASH